MNLDLLLVNGTVVTVNPSFDILHNAMVGIRDGRIEWLSREPDDDTLASASEVVDVNGGIVLPGLVNAHTHLPMTLFRGLADDLPLQQWLNAHMFPAENRFITEATVGPATRLACAEMLLSGTTTCCDGYFMETHVAEALAGTGMRGVLAQGVIDFPAPGVPDPARNVAHAAAYVDAWQNRCATIQPSIFCHSPYTCSADTLSMAKVAATDAGVLFQVHVAETRHELEESVAQHGASPIKYLDSLGVLDDRTLCIHSVWVDEEDREILSENSVAVVHCPHSNMKLGSGISPLPHILDAGICAALGTDGAASNNSLDMIAEMGTAARLHKADRLDPTVASARQVLTMATMGGAEAIGMAGDIGSIEPGKLADLTVIDVRQPHLAPLYDPVSQVVYAASGADVCHVLVGGRFLVRDRKLTTIDAEATMAEITDIAAEIRSLGR